MQQQWSMEHKESEGARGGPDPLAKTGDTCSQLSVSQVSGTPSHKYIYKDKDTYIPAQPATSRQRFARAPEHSMCIDNKCK